MNLLLFYAQELTSSRQLILTGERHQHIKHVLKLKTGDSISIGEINGRIGTGKIERTDSNQTTLTVTLDLPRPPKLPLSVAIALPRPKMFSRIIRNLAEFGVKDIHVFHSQKVEKSYWQSPVLDEVKIQRALLDGLSQSKDTLLPEVHFYKKFHNFIKDGLPSLNCEKQTYIAHPYQTKPLPSPLKSQESLMIIGPEGGFTEQEVKVFTETGAQAISMGKRIYRVENAVTLLLSRLCPPGAD